MTVCFTRLLAATPPDGSPVARPDGLTKLQATLADHMARKSELVNRWTAGELADTGLAEEDFFQLVGALNRKISALRESLAAGDPATSRAAEVIDPKDWRKGTVNQRRALLRRYLHGVQVLPPIKAPDGTPTGRLRQRLRPTWKTAEELIA